MVCEKNIERVEKIVKQMRSGKMTEIQYWHAIGMLRGIVEILGIECKIKFKEE